MVNAYRVIDKLKVGTGNESNGAVESGFGFDGIVLGRLSARFHGGLICH